MKNSLDHRRNEWMITNRNSIPALVIVTYGSPVTTGAGKTVSLFPPKSPLRGNMSKKIYNKFHWACVGIHIIVLAPLCKHSKFAIIL